MYVLGRNVFPGELGTGAKKWLSQFAGSLTPGILQKSQGKYLIEWLYNLLRTLPTFQLRPFKLTFQFSLVIMEYLERALQKGARETVQKLYLIQASLSSYNIPKSLVPIRMEEPSIENLGRVACVKSSLLAYQENLIFLKFHNFRNLILPNILLVIRPYSTLKRYF